MIGLLLLFQTVKSDEWNVTNCTEIDYTTKSVPISSSVTCYSISANSLVILQPLSNESQYLTALVTMNNTSAYLQNYGIKYSESGTLKLKSSSSSFTSLNISIFNYSSYSNACDTSFYTTTPTTFTFTALSSDYAKRFAFDDSNDFGINTGVRFCFFCAIPTSDVPNVTVTYTGNFDVAAYEKSGNQIENITTFKENDFVIDFSSNTEFSVLSIAISSLDSNSSYQKSTNRMGRGFGGFGDFKDDGGKGLKGWQIGLIIAAAVIVVIATIGMILCCILCNCYCGCSSKVSKSKSRVQSDSESEENQDKSESTGIKYGKVDNNVYDVKPVNNPYSQDEVYIHYGKD